MPVLETTQQYITLDAAYQFFKDRLFGGTLPDCFITLQRKNCEGYFSPHKFRSTIRDRHTDEIALNPDRFYQSEKHILSTLVHEMVHLWQAHFGTPSRVGYHNHEWAQKMVDVGLMPSNTGRPGGRMVGQTMSDYIIEAGRFSRFADELLVSKVILWESIDFARSKKEVKEITGDRVFFNDMNNVSVNSLLLVNNMPVRILKVDIKENSVTVAGGSDLEGAREVLIVNQGGKGRVKNKVKYTCPECGVNVWGRPVLKIICGECKVNFECFS